MLLNNNESGTVLGWPNRCSILPATQHYFLTTSSNRGTQGEVFAQVLKAWTVQDSNPVCNYTVSKVKAMRM